MSGPVAGHVQIEASAQLRSRSACPSRRAARDTTRRSRRHAAVPSAIFMHSAVLRAVFSKVDRPAVFMPWFLPAPLPSRACVGLTVVSPTSRWTHDLIKIIASGNGYANPPRTP